MREARDAIRIELNGAPARPEDLRALIATNYGHFTSMQVRDGRARGVQLHLDRLVAATRELFGSELDRERVRDWLRHVVGGQKQALSLRVNVFSRAFDRERPGRPVAPDVLVAIGPPAAPVTTPLRLQSFRYRRELPRIKHVGTFPLFHFRRRAQQAGFDDALFVDDADYVSEGSIWNIGFCAATGVVWPQAPQLRGISMQLLQAGLARRGIGSVSRPLQRDEMAGFRAAFFTNSAQPVRPIVRIDAIDFALDADLLAQLNACYETNPWEEI